MSNLLERPELLYETLVKCIPDGLGIMDMSLNIVFASESCIKMFGYDKFEDVKNKNILDFVSEDQKQHTFDLIERFKNNRIFENELNLFKMKKKDGSIFYTETNASLLREENGEITYIYFVLRDVTDKVLLEKTLKEKIEFQIMLKNLFPLPLFYKDKDMKYLDVNTAFENFVGISKDKIIGKTVYDLYDHELAKIYSDHDYLLVSESVEQTYETKVRRFDGEIRDVVFLKKRMTDNEGNFDGLIGIMYDISDRIERERLLTELNTTKDKFFSIISHDLRGPIGTSYHFLEDICHNFNEYSLDELKSLIEKISKSIFNTYNLLENLLYWAKSQQGNLKTRPEKFDLYTLISNCVDLLHANAMKKHITLKNNINIPIKVYADIKMIDTVIRNIISNSIKYTKKNGLIEISYEENDRYYIVKIKDNGIGMSENVQNSLFKINAKVSVPGTFGETGTGLGLLLCKEFMEKNNGELSFKSEVNHGTEFLISIPKADI